MENWRSSQARYDICITNEAARGNLLITIHGCGQIKVDGSPLVTIGSRGQITRRVNRLIHLVMIKYF